MHFVLLMIIRWTAAFYQTNTAYRHCLVLRNAGKARSWFGFHTIDLSLWETKYKVIYGDFKDEKEVKALFYILCSRSGRDVW